jgi:hypothetical protein
MDYRLIGQNPMVARQMTALDRRSMLYIDHGMAMSLDRGV